MSWDLPDNSDFLRLVAKDLVDRFGNDLVETVVVFPGVRASLFFNNYLYAESKKTIWAPLYDSIDSLFESASILQKGDPLLLTGELYKCYADVYNSHSKTPTTETLDEFFFFGETLLKDFDDIDKNLVNARLLFSNLQDLDQLRDDLAHLSEDQIEALMLRFGASFGGDSILKSAFRNIWNILGEVYTLFKQRLTEKGIAYPGMLMRSVIESEETLFPVPRYVFVGFNVLTQCEQKLFERLKGRSLFYWDYDNFYLKSEAGKGVKKNISRFGSALDESLFNSFLQNNKQITFMASPSESEQTAVVSSWIDSMNKPSSFTQPDSAIVLCNEKLLPAVMHSIDPGKVENVNITMGFPLIQTPVSSFIHALTELQTAGLHSRSSYHYKYVLAVLQHPYTRIIFPEAGEVEKEISENNVFYPDQSILKNNLLFTHTHTSDELVIYLLNIIQQLGIKLGEGVYYADPYSGLYNESVFRSFQTLNRLSGLLATEGWALEKNTCIRLLNKLLSTVKIPFHGEPVKGLQVMGVLETRALDFKNLLVLSVNEGFMPGSNSENSFIPEFLRKHFGLNTIEQQDSIYAYYFYRLIQRTENITLVYNTDKTQTGKAEMSRFMLQLLVNPEIKDRIKRYTLQSTAQPWQGESINIEKNDKLMSRLKARYDLNTNEEAYRLSPTALNTFISCSFKFYLQYMEGLKAQEEMTDELDNSIFGSIFHRASEYLYKEIGRIPIDRKEFAPFVVTKELLEPYIKMPHRIEKLVSRAFNKEYFKGKEVDTNDYNGGQLINHKVICHLLRRLVQFDIRRAPFTLIGLEYPVTSCLDLDLNNIRVRIGGIIDRLEEKDGKLYIVDYKSSGTAKVYKELADLFEQKDKRASHVLQTFVYASAMLQQKENRNKAIVPALLYLQQAGQDDYSPIIPYNKEPIEDFGELNSEFEALLKEELNKLFDPSLSFSQTEILSVCQYCDFKEMCNR